MRAPEAAPEAEIGIFSWMLSPCIHKLFPKELLDRTDFFTVRDQKPVKWRVRKQAKNHHGGKALCSQRR